MCSYYFMDLNSFREHKELKEYKKDIPQITCSLIELFLEFSTLLLHTSFLDPFHQLASSAQSCLFSSQALESSQGLFLLREKESLESAVHVQSMLSCSSEHPRRTHP